MLVQYTDTPCQCYSRVPWAGNPFIASNKVCLKVGHQQASSRLDCGVTTIPGECLFAPFSNILGNILSYDKNSYTCVDVC